MDILSINGYNLIKISNKSNPTIIWTISDIDNVKEKFSEVNITENLFLTIGKRNSLKIIDILCDEIKFIPSRQYRKYMRENYNISLEEVRSLLEFGDRNFRPIDTYTNEFTKFESLINGYCRYSNKHSQVHHQLLERWKDSEYKNYMSSISKEIANKQWSNPESSLRNLQNDQDYVLKRNIISSRNILNSVIDKYEKSYLYLAEIFDEEDKLKFGFTHFDEVSNRKDDWKGRENRISKKYPNIIKLISGPSKLIADIEMNLKLFFKTSNERIDKNDISSFINKLYELIGLDENINLECDLASLKNI